MKKLREIIGESVLDIKPGTPEHLAHHEAGYMKHSELAQSGASHDASPHDPEYHSRMATHHLDQIAKHHGEKALHHVMGKAARKLRLNSDY